MNKDAAQLAAVIQKSQKHHNEMGHPNGYFHELLNREGKPILASISYTKDVPQELLDVALDEDKNLKCGWRFRTTMLPCCLGGNLTKKGRRSSIFHVL